MNKKYTILLCVVALTLLSNCESCKGRVAVGPNSPAGQLVQKHIDYLKLVTNQSYSAENKTPQELDVAVAEIDKTGKEVASSYVVKIKNSCNAEEISANDKLLSCVNQALDEGLKSKVPNLDEYMSERCKDFDAPKSPECSQVIQEFFDEFEAKE